MTKLFSAITVTRNHKAGLQATADSLTQENHALFEWIVVDGASTDGSVEFLKTTNAQWVSEPDQGIYDAMNKGIARAKAEYILFLNAGDTLALPRTLDTLAEILKARPQKPDLIYGDAWEIENGAHVVKKSRPHTELAQGLFTHHQAIIYQREVINDLRYDTRYDIAADYKFTAEFLRRTSDVFYWPYPLCVFEQGGISQRRAFRGRMQQALIRQELGMAYPLQEIMTIGKQTLAYALRRFAPSLYWRLRATSV